MAVAVTAVAVVPTHVPAPFAALRRGRDVYVFQFPFFTVHLRLDIDGGPMQQIDHLPLHPESADPTARNIPIQRRHALALMSNASTCAPLAVSANTNNFEKVKYRVLALPLLRKVPMRAERIPNFTLDPISQLRCDQCSAA
jgi:hypothetical protein